MKRKTVRPPSEGAEQSERASTAARLLLPMGCRAELVRDSLAAWPREACGLLLGFEGATERQVTEVVPSANLHQGTAGRERFRLDPGAWRRAERRAAERGEVVLCTWHSHPRGTRRPSLRDWDGDPGFGWHVLVALPVVGPPSLWAWRQVEGRAQGVPIHGAPVFVREFPALPDSHSRGGGVDAEALGTQIPTRG